MHPLPECVNVSDKFKSLVPNRRVEETEKRRQWSQASYISGQVPQKIAPVDTAELWSLS